MLDAIRSKPIEDEEFYYTFHDRIVVRLFSSPNVDYLITQKITLKENEQNFIEQFFNLLQKNPELIEILFNGNFQNKIKENLKEHDRNELETILFSSIDLESNKIEFNSGIFKNKIEFEDIREIFQVTTSDEKFDIKPNDDFLKKNRRLTHTLCNKIIGINDGIYYCGIAQIPGVWLASSIRESHSTHIVDRIPIKNKPTFGKEIKYQRQQHLAESCSRQLLRNKSHTLMGNYGYSATYYRYDDSTNLVRFTIPLNDFLIGVNITESLFKELFANEINNVKQLKEQIQNTLMKKDNDDFVLYKTPPKSIIDKSNLQLLKSGTTDNIMLDNSDRDFSRIMESHPNIRWATIVTKHGKPLFRYQREGTEMRINGAEELDNLVETCLRHMTRLNVTDFFGKIQFTLASIENSFTDPDTGDKIDQSITKINCELGKFHILLCNFDGIPQLEKTPLEQVFTVIKELDRDLLMG